MKCKYCGLEVTLVPSATERAKKIGGTPEFYTRLFPEHTECILKERREATSKLMQKVRTP